MFYLSVVIDSNLINESARVKAYYIINDNPSELWCVSSGIVGFIDVIMPDGITRLRVYQHRINEGKTFTLTATICPIDELKVIDELPIREHATKYVTKMPMKLRYMLYLVYHPTEITVSQNMNGFKLVKNI